MTDTPPSPPVSVKRKTPSSKYKLLGIAALILSIAAIIIAALAWRQLSIINLSNNKQAMQQQTMIARLNKKIAQIQPAIKTNQQNISQLMTQTTQTTRQQAVAEAAYLIRLAHVHLVTDNNIRTAIRLLKLAKQRLQTITTPLATQFKVAIDKDISTLSAMPTVDLANVIIQLDKLSERISDLPAQPKLAVSPSDSSADATTSSEHWWDKTKHNLYGLKNLFIIRHIDNKKIPLISPQQIIFLKENVRLKLSQAEWALLHQQPEIYQQSLTIAAQWLSKFDQNQPAVEPIVKKIQALALMNIKPKLPTLQSLKILSSLSSPTKKSTDTESSNKENMES